MLLTMKLTAELLWLTATLPKSWRLGQTVRLPPPLQRHRPEYN